MAGSSRGPALARAVVRHRRWIFALWLAAGAALAPAASRLERTLDVAARVDGSESAAVEHELASRFASPFANAVVLVATGLPSPRLPEGEAVLHRIAASLDGAPGVTRTFSWLDTRDTLLLASSGTFLVVGLDAGGRSADALIAPLRARMSALAGELRAEHPSLTLRFTGEIALNHDLRQTSASDAQRAERRAMPLTLLLLVVAFGALAAALVPVASGVLSIVLALGAATVIGHYWTLSLLLQNVVSMLGLGLGVDYALLTVSRFREALRTGLGAEEAAVDAARHAGHTVALSGIAVAIGFAALLFVPLNELRSVAVGGLLVVAFSVLIATTLLPALLAAMGTRIDAGRIVRRRAPRDRQGWLRWGRWVAAYPVIVLVAAGAPVVWLAAQALRLSTELPRGDWLPPAMESAQGVHDLQRMGRAGIVQSVRVLIDLPPGTTAIEGAGWAATRRVGDWLAADERVARVRSLPASLGGADGSATLISLLPSTLVRTFVSADERAAVVEAVPREEAGPESLTALVRELRAMPASRLTGLAGARVRVGGLPAFNVDYRDAIGSSLPLVVGLVVAGTFIVLAVGFRSLLIPLKAIALNLLSVAAAFGAVVLVFQDGHGIALLGLAAPVSGVFPAVPVLVFCTVFGLSMDYEVFLVARVAEARRGGASDAEAMAMGLSRTGGVITSAAAIMIAVFAAFTLGGFLLIKMLGFALAVAVLLDATIVRVAIGPAMLVLAGRWNWWPGERRGARRVEVVVGAAQVGRIG